MKLYDLVQEFIEYNLDENEILRYQYSYTHQIDIQQLFKKFKKQYPLVDIDITKFNIRLNYICSEKALAMESMEE